MKTHIIRCISVLLVGVCLLVLGEEAPKLLVTLVGILFMIPGVVSLVNYLRHLDQSPVFPFAAAGSFLLGLWLAVSPAFFVSLFMYILGGVLVVLGGYQLWVLFASSKQHPTPWGLYISPALVLLLGALVLFNPFKVASIPFIIVGVGCIFSAANDLVAIYRQSKCKPSKDDSVEDAKIIES